MTLLRRALQAFAAVWAGCGLAVLLVPRWILVTWFHQVEYPDYAYVRVTGVAAVALALLAVLVSRRVGDVWWWSWAFALAATGTATVTALHALFTVPQGSEAWFWWLFAASNVALAAGLVMGIARAGQENPIV